MPDARVIPIDGDNGPGRRRTGEAAGGDGYPTPLPSNVFESPDVEQRVAEALAFLRHRITGDYEVDEFGFDPELQDKVLLEPFRVLYEKWFRVETRGWRTCPTPAAR